MFWIELIIVLAIIFIGVRVGGTFLAMAGGIGMFIMTFILHVTPSDPPITVILIMIAVICAAATMQACGGLDYLVRIAEKILRKNPKMITVLAPVVAYIFTFMCGTGHIVYSLLPVINEIAIETGVRPERPISASIVSSQQAITACPISAATVGILAFMAEATNYTKVNIFTLLIVCVPATLIGNGLAEGSYWLVETQAPDGYNKLTAPVKITITKSDTTNVDDWTIKQNDGVVDDKIIDIENTTGTLLPETGGMGTVIFTVIAVVMILGIAVSFVISRRKRA